MLGCKQGGGRILLEKPFDVLGPVRALCQPQLHVPDEVGSFEVLHPQETSNCCMEEAAFPLGREENHSGGYYILPVTADAGLRGNYPAVPDGSGIPALLASLPAWLQMSTTSSALLLHWVLRCTSFLPAEEHGKAVDP